jgi:hypothetical protein
MQDHGALNHIFPLGVPTQICTNVRPMTETFAGLYSTASQVFMAIG